MNARVEKYLKQNFRVRYNTPLERANFVIYDTETTGLDIKTDTVISIGAVKIKNNRVVMKETFEAFLRGKSTGKGKSVTIHNILKEEIKNAPKEKKVLQRFLEFLGNDVIIGHHIKFDIKMVDKSLKKHFHTKIKNPYYDTGFVYNRLNNTYSQNQFLPEGAERVSLDYLIEKYDLPIFERHSAVSDALASAFLFQKLLNNAKAKKIKTVGQLFKPRLLNWSKYL